jgi:hypothetical protein
MNKRAVNGNLFATLVFFGSLITKRQLEVHPAFIDELKYKNQNLMRL